MIQGKPRCVACWFYAHDRCHITTIKSGLCNCICRRWNSEKWATFKYHKRMKDRVPNNA